VASLISRFPEFVRDAAFSSRRSQLGHTPVFLGRREKRVFRPFGAALISAFTHGLRRGLYSCAASRLRW
jgi:hypothetical protein